MLIDADPDRSGEIDFEEFVTFIKAQMSKGATGGLAEVVKEAAGFFGLFSGFFSFFSGFGGGSGGGFQACRCACHGFANGKSCRD